MSWFFRTKVAVPVLGAALAVLVLGGCGTSQAAPVTKLAAPGVALEAFPSGVGRGFPIAQVAGELGPGFGPERGAPAPDFGFSLEDGRMVRLSDLQGRPVVVNFWATWCGPCRLEMPALVKAAQEHQELVVLAVNQQEARSQAAEFAQEFAMTMPIVLDMEGKVRQLYQVRGFPTTYFIDRAGNVDAVVAGPLTPKVLTQRLAEIEK